jgi:hypothetical protein
MTCIENTKEIHPLRSRRRAKHTYSKQGTIGTPPLLPDFVSGQNSMKFEKNAAIY